MELEELPGWDALPETDKETLRKFRTWLRTNSKVKNGEALEAPELLHKVIFGENDEI